MNSDEYVAPLVYSYRRSVYEALLAHPFVARPKRQGIIGANKDNSFTYYNRTARSCPAAVSCKDGFRLRSAFPSSYLNAMGVYI